MRRGPRRGAAESPKVAPSRAASAPAGPIGMRGCSSPPGQRLEVPSAGARAARAVLRPKDPLVFLSIPLAAPCFSPSARRTSRIWPHRRATTGGQRATRALVSLAVGDVLYREHETFALNMSAPRMPLAWMAVLQVVFRRAPAPAQPLARTRSCCPRAHGRLIFDATLLLRYFFCRNR